MPPTEGRSETLRAVVYEGSVHAAGLGGARFHFLGLARALAELVGQALVLVVPRYRGIGSLQDEAPPNARFVELPSGPRAGPGFLVYELRKAFWFVRQTPRLRRRGRRPVLVTRLSYHGLSTVVPRLLGWRVLLEVNGVPREEVRDRGLSLPARAFIVAAAALQIRCATALVCVTPGIAAAIGAGRPTHVVPNGVDLATFMPAPAERATSRRALIFVGSFAPWQDVALVLRAMAALVEAEPGAGWTLRLVGDGEDAESLRSLTAALGLAERVEFLGWRPHEEVPALIAESWICLVPLRRKGDGTTCGSPLKLFEYLASNRWVVASDVDGVDEIESPLLRKYREGDLGSLVASIRAASAADVLVEAELAAMRQALSWQERATRLLRIADEDAA